MDHPKPFVITIVGPESSGKTTLARELASNLGCPWVPEYARGYLSALGRDYSEEDLLLIAHEQWRLIREQLTLLDAGMTREMPAPNRQLWTADELEIQLITLKAVKAGERHALGYYREFFGHEPRPIVVLDGGMLTLRMWARLKYGISIPLVEEVITKDITSLYILCRPVLPWEQDVLREAPSLLDRAWIYNQYLKEMVMFPLR